jgi:hypothetical protein
MHVLERSDRRDLIGGRAGKRRLEFIKRRLRPAKRDYTAMKSLIAAFLAFNLAAPSTVLAQAKSDEVAIRDLPPAFAMLGIASRISGPARTRTEDQGIHSAPPFPEGVDYLFTP